MNGRRHLPFGIMIVASALIAAVLTFGNAALTSPVSSATADDTTGVRVDACAGQAWPNYSSDCLSVLAQQADRSAPTRILKLTQASY